MVVFGIICETLKLIMRRSSEIEVEKLNGISYEPLKSISGSLQKKIINEKAVNTCAFSTIINLRIEIFMPESNSNTLHVFFI